eukprot:4388932-Amphidinium_carterae.1
MFSREGWGLGKTEAQCAFGGEPFACRPSRPTTGRASRGSYCYTAATVQGHHEIARQPWHRR